MNVNKWVATHEIWHYTGREVHVVPVMLVAQQGFTECEWMSGFQPAYTKDAEGFWRYEGGRRIVCSVKELSPQ